MNLTHAQRRRIDRIAAGRSDEYLYLLEGPRAVRDAMETGSVEELWIRRDLAGALREDLVAAARDRSIRVGEGSRADFERLARTVTPQGVLALVRDTARSLDGLLETPGMLLWLDGLQDPGNVGAVVRVAAGLGAAGVIVTEGTADPLGLKALRASAGLALRVPFARGAAAAVGGALGARPAWVLEASGEDVFAVGGVPRDLVLVVGSEARGPGEAARAVAARRVGVPLAAGIDSLNAAVAAGIAVAVLRRGVAS